ncbi:S8 family serine peptidase [Clostridium sp. BJN0001]|uniref:S8 family serine peptidase n=1 Tax=Clostridium sp. BJN0001 TaxID=2930219 RepID=UPI001FD059D4|nr:S8 family serine peptidase [Clostridium sp. BJN0001]
MFHIKNKFDNNLKYYISNGYYRKYRVLIKYKKFESSIAKKIKKLNGEVICDIPLINLICANMSSKALKRISEYPEIIEIHLDEFFILSSVSSSFKKKVNLSHKFTLKGNGIGVGIIDSGVYPHNDLMYPSHKINFFLDTINNLNYPYDDNGHGTAVAGLISGSGILSEYKYNGIAEKTKLFCIKAFDCYGKGYVSDILYSIEVLINIASENNIKVICLPCEMMSDNTFILSLFDEIFAFAVSKGLIPIVPAKTISNSENLPGNLGIGLLKNCITVGGVDTSHREIDIYKYSSRGCLLGKNMKPDISAPCSNIICLSSDTEYISERNGLKLYPRKLDKPYRILSGTALAASYTAGLCSLICEKYNDVCLNDVLSILKLSTDETSDISDLIIGNGVIDVNKLFNSKSEY